MKITLQKKYVSLFSTCIQNVLIIHVNSQMKPWWALMRELANFEQIRIYL